MIIRPSRRQVLVGAAASLALGPVAASAQPQPATDTLERARDALASLSPSQRNAASFAFDDPVRRRWNFMGASAKPGLQLHDMTSD